MCATTMRTSGRRFSHTGRLRLPVLSETRFLKRLVGGCSAPVTIDNARNGAAAASVVSRVLLRTGASPALSVNNVLGSVRNGVHINRSNLFITRTYRCAGDFLDFFPGVNVVLGVRRSRLSFFGSLTSVHTSFHGFTRLLPTSNALFVGNSVRG